MASSLAEDLYGKLVNEEDARVCREIPDSACREVPRNFFLLVGSYLLTKLGDALSSPKTVLAWVMAAVGAPTDHRTSAGQATSVTVHPPGRSNVSSRTPRRRTCTV